MLDQGGSKAVDSRAHGQTEREDQRNVKTIWSLDDRTDRALGELARRWKVTRSEALRRVIYAAAIEARAPEGDLLAALDALQKSLALSPKRAYRWSRRVREERGSTSRRSGSSRSG